MLIVGIAVAIAFLAAGATAYWFRLTPAEQSRFGEALEAHTFTLLALLLLALAPPALLAPLPAWLPRWLLAAMALGIWGVFAVRFWDGWVVPAEALQLPPRRPLLPGLAPVAPPLPLPPVLDGDVLKSFRWTYTPHDGLPVEMTLEVALSTERYQAARAEARQAAGDWAHYAVQDMPELDTLTAAFHSLHHGRDWSTLEQASNVLCFTQACIAYKSDEETTPAAEWPRYPIETLMDETGDCEDDVILTAAVLKRLGFEVALLYYPGHCALGLAGAEGLPGEYVADPHSGLRYFYGETTAEGWHLGEVPESYRGRRPEKVEVVHRVVGGA